MKPIAIIILTMLTIFYSIKLVLIILEIKQIDQRLQVMKFEDENNTNK